MGFSELYLSLGQKRNISHFANIVRIAKSDQKVSPEEIAFLTKVSKKYNISNEEFRMILQDPDKIPTIAHLESIDRIERLYDLLIMIRADHEIQKEEVSVLRKMASGLGFPINKVDLIVDESVKLDVKAIDIEIFTQKILGFLKLQ